MGNLSFFEGSLTLPYMIYFIPKLLTAIPRSQDVNEVDLTLEIWELTVEGFYSLKNQGMNE